jgi:hypothetical protein
MSITEREMAGWSAAVPSPRSVLAGVDRRPRDLQQTCRLTLATLWLLDAVLQLQPYLFSGGSSGLSGMLRATAAGNPSWIAHTIAWNASIVDHHRVWTNALFAAIQFSIGFGIAWRRTIKQALALSIVWSIAVWWFGEGLGAILHGGATPFGGGPGGALFYAVGAVLLWPIEGSDMPFVAARALGVAAAKSVWVMVWTGLVVLSIVGSGRSPVALRDLVADVESGEPRWLVDFDHSTESLLFHHGTTLSVLLAILSAAVVVAVYLPPRATRVLLGLAIVVYAAVWVSIQNFGGILTGEATDPNSAPLIILFSLMYWPLRTSRSTANEVELGSAVGVREV